MMHVRHDYESMSSSPNPSAQFQDDMTRSMLETRYLTTASGPSLTWRPVGMACVLIPGMVERAMLWISSCCSGVHYKSHNRPGELSMRKGREQDQSRGRHTIEAQYWKRRRVSRTHRYITCRRQRTSSPGGGCMDINNGRTPSIAGGERDRSASRKLHPGTQIAY